MLNISDYPVHETEKQRWGNCAHLANDLMAFNDRASADRVFKYLNRPLPDDVRPDDQVDVSVLMPPIFTAAEIAEKSGKSIDQVNAWVDEYSDGFDIGGQDSDGNYLYYWENLERELSPELITVNKASEAYTIDKRTAKKRLQAAVNKGTCTPPVTKHEGGREYSYYRADDVRRLLG